MANLTQTSLIKSAVYARPGEGNIGETGLHTCRENTYQVSIKQPDFPLKNTTSHPNHLQFRERKKKNYLDKRAKYANRETDPGDIK